MTFRPVLDSSIDTGYSPAFQYIPNEDDPDNPTKIAVPGVDEQIGITISDNPNFDSYVRIKIRII